jgi:signal transduction histidine kinase
MPTTMDLPLLRDDQQLSPEQRLEAPTQTDVELSPRTRPIATHAGTLELIRASVGVLCHAAALAQYVFYLPVSQAPPDWPAQFYFLLTLSLFLALAVSLAKSRALVVLLAFMRMCVLIPMGYPLGDYLGIEFTILIPILVDLGLRLSYPLNMTCGGVAAMLLLLFQTSARSWDALLPSPPAQDIVWIGTSCAVVIIFAALVQHHAEQMSIGSNHVRRIELALSQLMAANLGFQRLVATVEQQSKLDERKRVSREIHDTVGYALTNLMMMMEAALDHCPAEATRARSLLLRARKQAQEGLNETRRALRVLRSRDEGEGFGLKAIHKLARAFAEVTGVHVKLEWGNLPWVLSEAIGPAVYRFVQEGLTNAFTHGKATEIRLAFWQTDGHLLVNVHDNGSGSSTIKEGIGLAGMRERVEQLGGQVAARNLRDGFELLATIPRSQAVESGEADG